MTLPVIGFAGLTHLGLVSGIGTASKGFTVVGYDANEARVADIVAGRLPVTEPDLDELAARHADRLRFSADVDVLRGCDIVYISADVPTDESGTSDLTGISALIEQVLPAIRGDAILVILCQVPPGFTRGIRRAFDRLYYQVETLIFGRAVERAIKPERFIIGSADPTAPLPDAYSALLGAFDCPILPMRYESAELTKIVINVCLAASVTVANTMAEIAERIGADWGEISPALKLDRRIGQYAYLTPGLGLAGGNIERDLATVLRFSERIGSEASVVAAYLANSRHARDWALRVLHREVLASEDDPILAVLGLAYKENTGSTKNSPSLALLQHLREFRVQLYDPVVPAAAAAHPKAEAAKSGLAAAKGADALVIMTPWPEFRYIDPAALAHTMRGRVIIDPYGVLDRMATRGVGFAHFRMGSNA
jgi:UDPglucose 6-dehydrogenase